MNKSTLLHTCIVDNCLGVFIIEQMCSVRAVGCDGSINNNSHDKSFRARYHNIDKRG